MPRKQLDLMEVALKVAEDTAEIKTSIGINSEKIGNIEKHLETLNGKVATQESNTSTLKSAVDILISKEQTRSKFEWLTIENIFKVAFGLLLAFLVYRAGL